MISFKIALIAYTFIYNGLLIIGRSYMLYKKTGINPLKKMGKDDAAGFNEKVLIFGASLIPVIAIVYAFFEKIYTYFLPILYLENEFLKYIGLLLSFGGLAIALTGQLQMGNAWRTGIDKNIKTELVTHGLFKYSRNPIYLGLLISLVGFFMMAPNAVSLCCAVLAYPSIEMKIRFEEAHMEKIHSVVFAAYKKKVNRWLL